MNRVVDTLNHTPMGVKATMDGAAAGIAWVGFFTDFLPIVATALSIVWLCLQIYTWFVNKKWKRKE